MGARVLEKLRALGADVERLPKIPLELADHVATLTPEDIERIRADVRELKRLGVTPRAIYCRDCTSRKLTRNRSAFSGNRSAMKKVRRCARNPFFLLASSSRFNVRIGGAFGLRARASARSRSLFGAK